MRFIDAKILTTIPCTECGGQFIVHKMDLHNTYVCGMCNMPSRAGQTNKARAERESRAGMPDAEAIVPALPLDSVVAQATTIPRRRSRLRHAVV